MSRWTVVAGGLCVFAVLASGCAAGAAPSDGRFEAFRADALARAKVFRTTFAPEVLAPGSNQLGEVACRFVLTPATGTTPKFDCELPSGRRVKVKYGGTPEVAGELATSRLLAALGFGADRVMLASRVRCHGCPASPFYARRVADWTHLEGLLRRTRNYDAYRDFEWAAVEYKLDAEPVEADTLEGWGFYELDRIDSARGGADPGEVDALRLMAVFLAHWDNKASNQRLVCLPGEDPTTAAARDDACRRPLVMLQDVGATFGPRKVDLDAWRETPVWADAASCRVSMKSLPHGGATFADVQIAEQGRRVLADRLSRLTTSQIETLFAEARFPGDVSAWVVAFQQKVDAIAARPPCPQA